MRIVILGAGPAGLYLAYLIKRRQPDADVSVFEQNAANATFGFGVVFSDKALDFLREDDPQTHAAIAPHMESWNDITLVHRGEYGGKPYIDKGEILEFDPPRRLVHTHWSDVSGLPDAPEHYQVVAWDLTERDDGTELVITERNLPSQDAAATSEQGWTSALGALKALLES